MIIDLVDYQILKLLSTREAYSKAGVIFNSNKVLPDNTLTILHAYEQYFKSYPEKQAISWGDFPLWYLTNYNKKHSPEEIELYKNTVFPSIIAAKIPDEVSKDVIKKYAEESAKELLRLSVSEYNDSFEDIKDKVDAVTSMLEQSTQDEDYNTWDSEAIATAASRVDGFSWRSAAFNKAAGRIGLGDLMIVASRNEIGKTSFMFYEAPYIAQQIDEGSVLCLTSELSPNMIKATLLRSVTGLTAYEVSQNVPGCLEALGTFIKGDPTKKIIIRPIDSLASKEEIVELCEKHNVKFIMIDMIDALASLFKVSKALPGAELYRVLYQWLREKLANVYAPVCGTTQLSSGADGLGVQDEDIKDCITREPAEAYLENSQTGKQAAATIIMTIGYEGKKASIDCGHHKRFIRTTKNKFNPLCKEQVQVAYLDPLRCQITDKLVRPIDDADIRL